MTSTARMLAAIDIGSSGIRMDIAEIHPDGQLRLLDSLKKGVQLGKDTFVDGKLSEDSIRACCDVLRDFKKVMDTYGSVQYRAVATSAVRECSNSDTLLDRVLMSTGLEIEVLDGPEENRLIYTSVLDSIQDSADLEEGSTLLVEVGGGSADVTLLTGGEPVQSGTFPLGSIRLRSGLADSGPPSQQLRLIKRQIRSRITNIHRTVDLQAATNYVAVGGDMRFAVDILRPSASGNRICVLDRKEFASFVGETSKLTLQRLVRKYSLSYVDAETLVPALLTYLQLLRESRASKIIVSRSSIREGILRELIPAEQGTLQEKRTLHILSAARNLGRKYKYDEAHAERVREIAELLFDDLRMEQRMDPTHRLYLQVAALLHDIGLFINTRGHHKHSYYLIAASDLFGLRRRELEIIANVARYHRRALPQRNHAPYMNLDREDRLLVSKLAAILRVANAFDIDHLQKATDLKIVREGDSIVLLTDNRADLTTDRIALSKRSELFTQVFGKKILLREMSDTL